uniref:Uncharacterized protein n=1 Tax=Ditylenchus dipsaci TaxID=166011 RepID=A0A915EE66_9BILA
MSSRDEWSARLIHIICSSIAIFLVCCSMYRKSSLEKGLVPASPVSNNVFRPPRSGIINSRFEDYPSKPPKDGCLSRVPYSSLMAFVMCFIGVILFSIMMTALNITDIPWLDKIHIVFVITALLMVTVALVLLCIGILSTGSTREEVFKRESARQGGRISCIVAITLSYLLNILWIGIVSVTAIFSFVYYVFGELCSSLTAYTENDCLDFSVLRPLVKDFSESTLILCGGNVQQFCALTNTVLIWYIVGFIGSLIVTLGLVQFIASNSANYAHVNSEQRYAELQEVLQSETSGAGMFLGNTNKLMDEPYHVDYHPQYQQPGPEMGTFQRRNLPPPPSQPIRMRSESRFAVPQQQFAMDGGNVVQQQPRPHTTVGGTLSNMRRNSYTTL